MIILGIDPGSQRVGYGLISKDDGKIKLLDAGLLKIKEKDKKKVLSEISIRIGELIKKWRPEIMAIEKLYFVKNQKTGLEVAQSRGVIVLSATEHNLSVKEYSPNEIKAAVTGYGLADKKSVAKMVRLILNEPDLKIIDDASDALAGAITASNDRLAGTAADA